jgi:hypothetical protein
VAHDVRDLHVREVVDLVAALRSEGDLNPDILILPVTRGICHGHGVSPTMYDAMT